MSNLLIDFGQLVVDDQYFSHICGIKNEKKSLFTFSLENLCDLQRQCC